MSSRQKTCCRCEKTRLVSEFWKNSATPDGLQHYCIRCLKKYEPRKDASRRYEAKHTRNKSQKRKPKDVPRNVHSE